ncbi:MAG: peptidoglycan DD-metalloendopeptidase family protein, partial [Paracoccus sp. (in: a-proteobacteria)]|nr:peptidoglycan DD-metalloendopeptidase family protein [Paracoccus sp. (in: a-proteobacteria)]
MSSFTIRSVAALGASALLAACQPGGLPGLGGPGLGAPGAAPAPEAPGQAAPGGTGAPLVTDPFAGQGVQAPAIPDAPGGQRGPVTAPATSSLPVPTAGAAPAPGAAPQASPAPAARPAAPTAAQRHQVSSGETAWSIARRYNVSIQDLAQANGLDSNMTVRLGQNLTIPAAGGSAAASASVTAPGRGSPTPEPPSASTPLPDERTQPAASPAPRPDAPNLGATRTAASGSGRFRMPVPGAITRTYARGSYDGIAISAPSGTSVTAAGAGEVAAITQDTNGANIVVLRHSDGLLTVYAGLSQVSVARGAQVSAGQALGTSGA